MARSLEILARELGVGSLSIDALRDSLLVNGSVQGPAGSCASSDSGHSGQEPEEAGANQQTQNFVPFLRTLSCSAPDLFKLKDVVESGAAAASSDKALMSESFNARLKSGFRRATRRNSTDERSLSDLGDSSKNRAGIWGNLSGFQAQEEKSSQGLWKSCGTFFRELRRRARIAAQHPDIWLVALLVLLVLLGVSPKPSTLNPQPSTLNPQPSTLHPPPSTL